MNLRDRIQELLEFQKTNPTVEEIYERFYDENVVVQENLEAPRVGRALSIDRQKQMNANVQELHDLWKKHEVPMVGFTMYEIVAGVGFIMRLNTTA